MRRVIGAVILSLALSVPVLANDKVTICHVPPGNPANAHSITISENAAAAHFRNHEGDYEGECKTDTVEPTPSPSPSPDGTNPEPSPSLLPDTAMR